MADTLYSRGDVRFVVEGGVATVTFDRPEARNAMTFEIEGDLWAQPLPMRIYLQTELDLEMGDVRVIEASGPGAR